MLVAAATALALCLAACGSSGDNSGEKKKAAKKDTGKVEMLESGYSVTSDGMGSWYVQAGAVVENKSRQNAYEFPVITVTAYDKDGNVVSTGDQTQGTIQPGEKQAVAVMVDCDEKPAKANIELDTGEKIAKDTSAVLPKDFKVSGKKVTKDGYGDTKFSGQITNNSKKDLDDAAVVIVLKKGKKIVYADNTFTEKIRAGAAKAYSLDIYDAPDYDTYSVYVYNWS